MQTYTIPCIRDSLYKHSTFVLSIVFLSIYKRIDPYVSLKIFSMKFAAVSEKTCQSIRPDPVIECQRQTFSSWTIKKRLGFSRIFRTHQLEPAGRSKLIRWLSKFRYDLCEFYLFKLQQTQIHKFYENKYQTVVRGKMVPEKWSRKNGTRKMVLGKMVPEKWSSENGPRKMVPENWSPKNFSRGPFFRGFFFQGIIFRGQLCRNSRTVSGLCQKINSLHVIEMHVIYTRKFTKV